MAKYVVAYIATFIVFIGIDIVWLMSMAGIYRRHLGHVLADNFNPTPAVLFYLIYIAGIMVFAIAPAFATGKWTTAALYGALFGFFAYATYDLTNHATIRDWPVVITIADLCWGSLLTAVSASLGFLVTRYLVQQG